MHAGICIIAQAGCSLATWQRPGVEGKPLPGPDALHAPAPWGVLGMELSGSLRKHLSPN